jgi:hypothetical protein
MSTNAASSSIRTVRRADEAADAAVGGTDKIS